MATHFSHKKCNLLTLGKFYNITRTEKCTLHRQELEHVFELKDLGVILDAVLKFAEHISMKVEKANTIIGLIRRTFSYLDGPLFKKLFTTFVRPHLEYVQVIWTPHMKNYVTILENVQHRATKLVDGFYHMSTQKEKTESTIAGLQESSRRYDRDFKTLPLLQILCAT